RQPVERAAAALTFFGLRPWTEADLCREAGLSLLEVPAVIEQLGASGTLVELPLGPRRTVRVLAEFADDLDDRVLRALGRLHAAHPRQSAIRRAHVLAALPDLDNDALVSGLIDRLRAQGRVVGDDRTIALKGHEPRLSHGERRLKGELAEVIRA